VCSVRHMEFRLAHCVLQVRSTPGRFRWRPDEMGTVMFLSINRCRSIRGLFGGQNTNYRPKSLFPHKIQHRIFAKPDRCPGYCRSWKFADKQNFFILKFKISYYESHLYINFLFLRAIFKQPYRPRNVFNIIRRGDILPWSSLIRGQSCMIPGYIRQKWHMRSQEREPL
jgi:hypothetical protein